MGESPQKGLGKNPNAGYAGARINSSRGGTRGWTKDCKTKNTAEKRNVYYAGWKGCNYGLVALEAMIKRFQIHNFLLKSQYSAYEWDKAEHSNALKTVADGYVGNDSLLKLHELWDQYYSAYSNFTRKGVINVSDGQIDEWISAAVNLWEKGLGDYIPATYTEKKHQDLLESLGLDRNWKSREQLLKAWKVQ